jgi:hypothetical protein
LGTREAAPGCARWRFLYVVAVVFLPTLLSLAVACAWLFFCPRRARSVENAMLAFTVLDYLFACERVCTDWHSSSALAVLQHHRLLAIRLVVGQDVPVANMDSDGFRLTLPYSMDSDVSLTGRACARELQWHVRRTMRRGIVPYCCARSETRRVHRYGTGSPTAARL